MLKRIISFCTAVIIGIVGIFSSRVAYAADTTFDYSSIFDFSVQSAAYSASLKSDYLTILQGKNITEIEYPETYNDGTNGEMPVTCSSIRTEDNYITSIKFNKQQSHTGGSGALAYLKSLKKVIYPYAGTDFLINGQMVRDGSASQSTSLQEVYIYAQGLDEDSITKGTNAFRLINSSVTIYVTNEEVKKKIVEMTSAGNYSVSEDQIKIMENTKEIPSFTIKCEDIVYGDTAGFNPQITIDKGDSDASIVYQLYSDEKCENKVNYEYNSPYLPIGTYYVKATMLETESYQALSQVVGPVAVTAKKAISTEILEALKAAISEAETFYNENQYHSENYDTTKWNAVYDKSSGALAKAQEIVSAAEGTYSDNDATKATDALTDAFKDLKDSSADLTGSWESLSTLITQAEGIVAKVDNGEVKYTEETYTKLTTNLKSAKDLLALKDKDQTVTKTQIDSQIGFLQTAIDGLKKAEKGVTPGKPFAYIQKGGKATKVASLTADKDMAGVTSIKVTFDCAEDVSFNEWASIDLDATVAGQQSSQQIAGNNGTNGATCSVVLPLKEAVKEGDSIELKVATWSWDDAKDYVYGITKVEFINDKDEIVRTIIDKDIFKESLSASIADAEKKDTSAYTEESVAKLTKAIEAAKALTDEATAEELEKAIQDIEEAIKGLTKKADGSGSDGEKDPGKEDDTTKVIGIAKGKTFTAGNFQYKVTTAATITGTKTTVGKVTVVGLTKTGKKISSISVKNTVSKSGASYSVTAIASKAFKKATKLKKATLGTNVKAIPTSAFEGCKKLKAVSAKGVTKIGKKSFKNCKALKKLTLKKKVSVKKGAFKGCKKTIKVTGGSKKINKANVKKLKKSGYKKFK